MLDSRTQHLENVARRRSGLNARLTALFPEPLGLTLEIGSGHGHWLVDYATAHPQRSCLGLDLIWDRVERANRKAERAGATNVSFIKAEAVETLELLPSWVRVEEVFLLFPDPWPKKRHWKKRLFCDSFLALLAKRSSSHARVYFRTDHQEYFAWAENAVSPQNGWAIDRSEPWPFERETVFQSRAEQYRSLVLVKPESTPPNCTAAARANERTD